MKLTIGKKMALGFGVVVVALVVMSGVNYVNLSELHQLESEVGKRGDEAVAVQEMTGMGNKLYSIIADAIINRDLDAVQKEWATAKKELKDDVAALKKMMDHPDEVAWANDVEQSGLELVRLFEKELLPVLKQPKSGMTAQRVAEIDEQIDVQKAKMSNTCREIAASLQEEMHEAQEHFEEVSSATTTISIVI
ncbi:MAG: hypothetical protein JXX29_15940 [Deltaproteobacteria bacterium]|nr:hypothetical protein [Deltaproteobacteria bacterium]MBN2673173.1 hypothetical protein [Deltaproteobacteria bacterium]